MSSTSGIGSQKTIEQIIAAQEEATKSTRNTGELGKDDFLKLLITQVQYQDPLNPTTDTDFIAQMAQFSSLEQMQNLNMSFAYQSGLSMMGKFISADITDPVTGDTKYVDGIVESVRIINSEVYAVVGEDDVPLDKIHRVLDASGSPTGSMTDYSSIIGLLGTARVSNDDGKTSSIEGIIASVSKEHNGIIATFDEVDIKPYKLDIGAFSDEAEYVQYMAGQTVSIRFEDELTGERYTVTGTLRSGYMGEDGEVRLLLDGVKIPADDIYSTRKIDLFSTEQMLLNQILQEIRNQGAADTPEEPLNDENEGPVQDPLDEEPEISDVI